MQKTEPGTTTVTRVPPSAYLEAAMDIRDAQPRIKIVRFGDGTVRITFVMTTEDGTQYQFEPCESGSEGNWVKVDKRMREHDYNCTAIYFESVARDLVYVSDDRVPDPPPEAPQASNAADENVDHLRDLMHEAIGQAMGVAVCAQSDGDLPARRAAHAVIEDLGGLLQILDRLESSNVSRETGEK